MRSRVCFQAAPLRRGIILGCLVLAWPLVGLTQATSTGSSAASAPTAATGAGDTDDNTLEQVTVEASRPAYEAKLSPGTVTIVYPDARQGEQKRLPDLLKEVPGLHIEELNGAGQYTVASVRGSTAAQVGVFVDGVLMKLGGDAATDLSTIPVDNVVRIEVYRGYVPARFPGTWLGGVINVVTRRPEKLGGSVSAGVSSYDGTQGSISATAPLLDGSLFAGADENSSRSDFHYTDYAEQAANENAVALGQTPSLAPLARTRQNNGYYNVDGLLKWQDASWQVKASWKRNFRQLANPVWSNQIVDLASYPASNGTPVLQLPDLRWAQTDQVDGLVGRRQTWGTLEWGWRLTYLDQHKQYKNPDASNETALTAWSRYHSRRGGAAVDGSYGVTSWQLLEFTLNYSKEDLDVGGNNLSERPNIKTYYVQQLADAQLQDTFTLPWMSNFWFTPSASWNYSSGEGVSAEASLMGFAWQQAVQGTGGDKFTWQAALKKQLFEHLVLRSTYGTYARFPNLYELIGDGENIIPLPPELGPPLQPEHGTQWDVSAELSGKALGANADVTLSYFHRHSWNLMSLNRIGLIFFSYMNIGEGQAEGLELETHLHWRRWSVDLSGTNMQTEVLNPLMWNGTYMVNSRRGEPFGNAPQMEGTFRTDYLFPGDRLSGFAEVRYVGQLYENFSGLYQTPLTTVGLGAKYQLPANVKLTAGVNDLFDRGPEARDYAKPGTPQAGLWTNAFTGVTTENNVLYPLQGRTLYVTAQWDF